MTQETPELIAIAGAGVAGAWLYRTLTNLGRTVDVYDVPDLATACGIHPCAWGVSADFFRGMKRDRMDPEAYVTNRIAWVDLEGRTIPGELYLINKPRLVRALLDGARIRRTPIPAGRYDRILDCTGVARAYLPPTRQPDVLARTVQMRMHVPELAEDTIRLRYGETGYCWVFPLGSHRFHVGAVGLPGQVRTIRQMLRFVGLLDEEGQVAGCDAEEICGCESAIRLTGPPGAQPHVSDESPLGCPVWGVGESIGTVSPITGEGIMHAVRCAGLYLEHEGDPRAYSDAVVREFAWMEDERRVVEKVMAGRGLSLPDWRILQRNAANMGIRMSVPDLLAVLRTLLAHRRIHLSALIPRPPAAR